MEDVPLSGRIADDQVREDGHCQGSQSHQITANHSQSSPSRDRSRGAEEGIRKMEVGRGHEGDAHPLKPEPDAGRPQGIDLGDAHVNDVDRGHKGHEGTERASDLAPEVVGQDVHKEGKAYDDIGGDKYEIAKAQDRRNRS